MHLSKYKEGLEETEKNVTKNIRKIKQRLLYYHPASSFLPHPQNCFIRPKNLSL